MFLVDGCWSRAWGTVARSGSWQIDCSTTAITDQERKAQQMERFSDSFGSSLFGATVARGSSASGNFRFATSSPRDSQDAFHVTDDVGRTRERDAVGFEVLLCDPVADRRDSIIATIAEAGGTARSVGMYDLEQVADWPSSWRLALLALGSSFNQAPLEVIDRL